jgi:hypothetical protein
MKTEKDKRKKKLRFDEDSTTSNKMTKLKESNNSNNNKKSNKDKLVEMSSSSPTPSTSSSIPVSEGLALIPPTSQDLKNRKKSILKIENQNEATTTTTTTTNDENENEKVDNQSYQSDNYHMLNEFNDRINDLVDNESDTSALSYDDESILRNKLKNSNRPTLAIPTTCYDSMVDKNGRTIRKRSSLAGKRNIGLRPYYIVEVRALFSKLANIDTINQKFDAEVFIESKWIDRTLDATRDEYDPRKHWNPDLSVMNCMRDRKEEIEYMQYSIK